MTDTSKEYIQKVSDAAPFADNNAGIPEMVSLIKALAAERDAAQAEVKATHKENHMKADFIDKAMNDSATDYETIHTLKAKLTVAVDAMRSLPWRERDIKRGLILFRTSSNAHGSINFSALSSKIDGMPQSARDELAGCMINMAIGYSPERARKALSEIEGAG